MRLSIMAALAALVCFAAAGLAPAQCWGPSCVPAVAGPGFMVPAGHPAPLLPLDHQAFPRFVAGPGGCCSPRCSCGCNEGRECDCPHAKEARAAAPPAKKEELPTGVDGSKLGGKERITLGGPHGAVVVSPDEAREILTGQLKDDSSKKSLTLIGGTELDRKEFRVRLEGQDWLRDRAHIQDYPAGDPMVAKHDCDGLTLYLQERPSGKKLLHVKRITAGSTFGIIDRLKQALGLGTPPPPPPAPPLIGPDGTPLPPVPPQDGYSTSALAGGSILSLLAGVALAWWRSRQQPPGPPAAPVLPPAGPQPLPPASVPAPAPVLPAAPDPVALLEQAAWAIWQRRMSGTPLGQGIATAIDALAHLVRPLPPASAPAPAPQEQPKP